MNGPGEVGCEDEVDGSEISGQVGMRRTIVIHVRRAKDAFPGKPVCPQLAREFQTFLYNDAVFDLAALSGGRQLGNHPANPSYRAPTVRVQADREIKDLPG